MKIHSEVVSRPVSFLFVFLVEDKPDFWVYANKQFHRFLFLGEECRWIRSQDGLPSGSTGCCVKVTPKQQNSLERAGSAHKVLFSFFTDLMECIADASRQTYAGITMGMAFPAGALTGDGFVELQPAPNAKRPGVTTIQD